MHEGNREEFNLQLAALCAGFNVPVGDREHAYWRGLAKMSIIEFTRCVEYALGEEGPERIPTTHQIWGIRKNLRSRPGLTIELPLTPKWEGDFWDIQSNMQLRRYVHCRATAGVHYCCDETRFGHRSPHNPSEESRELTQPLVEAKKSWARDMREAAGEGKIPADGGKAWFSECMNNADRVIDQIRLKFVQVKQSNLPRRASC